MANKAFPHPRRPGHTAAVLGPRIVILAQDAATRDAALRVVEAVPSARGRGLLFELVGDDVTTHVAQRRALEPELPLGVLARDEPSALASLSAGADEALVLPRVDVASLLSFIDRIDLRARMRGEVQRLHAGLAHAEKLTALGTLVAGVGHEINNPLSAVLFSLFALKKRLLPRLTIVRELLQATEHGLAPSEELHARARNLASEENGRDITTLLDDMDASANAIATIVRDLRVFARSDEHERPEPFDVAQLIDHVLRLLGHDLTTRGVIERDYEPALPPLLLPRNRVAQVLTNLLTNAAHAIAEIERPLHKIVIRVRTDADFMAIAISDTGPGIPEDAIDRIFDPFFTTKGKELGTGLGLSISRTLLQQLGGDLSVDSVHGEGATFLCFLPIPDAEAVRTAKLEGGVIDTQGAHGRSVLVVDDDPRLLRSYARLLHPEHRLYIAQEGREAIELLASGSKPDLVIVEIQLPSRDGLELLEHLEAHEPELAKRTLIVTSHDSAEQNAQRLASYAGRVLHKPLRGETLLSALAWLAPPS